MRIIRSIAAVLAGLGFMAATATVGMLIASLALGRETPEVRLTSRAFSTFLFLNLVFCGIGGIFGGAKGAAIGASAGAGAGTAAVMAGGRNAATLPSGTPVTVRVVKPATVTVEE